MTVVQARMLPWTWQKINSHAHAQGQCGTGLGHGSDHGCGHKRPCFDKYIIVPSSSVTTQERVKFALQPCGSLATSCQNVFRPPEVSCSVDPFKAVPANIDNFSYDKHSEYYVPMD